MNTRSSNKLIISIIALYIFQHMSMALESVSAADDAVFAVTTGTWHTCLMFVSGKFKCFGLNSSGQLGYGDKNDRGAGVFDMGDNLKFVDVAASTQFYIDDFSCGKDFCCVMYTDQTSKCWGNGSNGQLGYGDANARGDQSGEMGTNLPALILGNSFSQTSMTTGSQHSCFVSSYGTLKCFGLNESGQLGLESTQTYGNTLATKASAVPVVNLGTSVIAARVYSGAGASHSCVITTAFNVKCWGLNKYGQLGYGDTNNRGVQSGQMGDALPFVNLGTGRKATLIVIGGTSDSGHTCAMLDNSQAKCWGSNQYGQLGYGDTVQRGDNANEMGDNLGYINFGTGRTVKGLSAGGYHTCAELDNARMKCFGRGSRGQLGIDKATNQGDTTATIGDGMEYALIPTGESIIWSSAGEAYTCVVSMTASKDTGARCFGDGEYGNLGNGHKGAVGLNPGEMGSISFISANSLPGVNVELSPRVIGGIVAGSLFLVSCLCRMYVVYRRSVANRAATTFISVPVSQLPPTAFSSGAVNGESYNSRMMQGMKELDGPASSTTMTTIAIGSIVQPSGGENEKKMDIPTAIPLNP